MTETAPTPIADSEFDMDTKLRMWTTTVALQTKSHNQSFEGALQNAEKIYNFVTGKGAPAESTLKVVKSLDDAR